MDYMIAIIAYNWANPNMGEAQIMQVFESGDHKNAAFIASLAKAWRADGYHSDVRVLCYPTEHSGVTSDALRVLGECV